MAFIPGQFDEVGDAQLPGHDKYPFLNQQPCGDYMLEVIELRGFLGQVDKVPAFAADFKVIEGPEGHAERVCFFTKRNSFYYGRDIKSLANALTGGAAPDSIDGAMMEALCGDEQPAAGTRCLSTVYDKDKKDQEGNLTGGTLRVNNFKPIPVAKG